MSEMASCRACLFMSEKLIVYAVPAKTVAVGVRVRLPALPAFIQAPVTPKMVACEKLRLPELVVDPERPVSTMVVFCSVP